MLELREASVEPNAGVAAPTVPHCSQYKVEVAWLNCLPGGEVFHMLSSACSTRVSL